MTVQVKGRVQCDDSDAVRRLALMGEGVACKSELDIAEELKRNTLVRLCEDRRGEAAPLYLACASRSQLRPVDRLLREFLVEQIATRTTWWIRGVSHGPRRVDGSGARHEATQRFLTRLHIGVSGRAAGNTGLLRLSPTGTAAWLQTQLSRPCPESLGRAGAGS